jgi:hypothetical protein
MIMIMNNDMINKTTTNLVTIGIIAGIGYLALRQFNQNTIQEAKTNRTTLRQENITERTEVRQENKTLRTEARQESKADRVESRQESKADRVESRQESKADRVESIADVFKTLSDNRTSRFNTAIGTLTSNKAKSPEIKKEKSILRKPKKKIFASRKIKISLRNPFKRK